MFSDKVNLVFVIYYLIYIVIFANGNINITFTNDDYVTNRSCIIQNSGLQGICVPFSKCKNAQITLRDHKINPTNCYYNSLEPVVCCSDIFVNDFDQASCRKTKIQCFKTPDGEGTFAVDCMEKACKEIVTNFQYGFDGCKEIVTNFQYEFDGMGIIDNGIPTHIGDYPFMAAIGFRQNDGDIFFNCGGFLVTRKFVITAAHCINVGGDFPVVVRTGGIDLDNNTAANLNIPIKNTYIHPLYKRNEAYHDIALIELTRESNDSPKCLLNQWYFENYTGIVVIAVGYGQISFGGPTSNRLLEIDLVINSYKECQKHYPLSDFLPRGILPSQICAIDLKKENPQDTCQGDSGGPLLTLGVPRLVGITSFGNFCGSKTPGVYTKVQYYLDWLESIIWPNI